MTIPSTQPRKSTSPPPSVCSGSRGAVTKQCGRVTPKGESTCSTCCVLLVAIVLVGFGSAGMLLYRHFSLDWNMHTYHDGDQVLVSNSANDLNSILCETYSVKSGDRADVYLTDGPAKISHSMREVIRVSDMGLMADDNFDFRAFYLLPGSEIEVRACMHQLAILHARVDVIIVRGDDKFRKWLGDTSCADCIEHRIALPPLGLCSIAHYVVEKKDTYYVIFTRAHRQDARQPVRAELDMKVSKTIYDFTNAKQTCHLARSCQLNLTYGASDDVIVQFPGKGTLPATSTYFTTECQLRRAFWVVVFGVVPAVLILLLLTCCLCSMRSSAKHSAAMREKKKRVGRAFTVSDNQTKQTESAGDANPAV